MRRVVAPLLAAVTTVVAAWPLTELFTAALWLPGTGLALLALGAAGVAARMARRTGLLVVALQVAAAAAVLSILYTPSALAWGVLPSPALVDAWAGLVQDAADSVASHPPPAPTTVGVTAVTAALLTGIGIAADAIAVTWRHPAPAAVPVLIPFLVAVANSDGELPVRYFIAVAVSWTALLATQESDRRRGWDVQAASGGARRRRFGRAGASAVLAILIAIVAAGALPHLPPRLLPHGAAHARGEVGFSPDVDLLRDLTDSSTDPVLRFRTTQAHPGPLRVSVSERYGDGRWDPHPADANPSTRPKLAYPAGLGPAIAHTRERLDVVENRLAAPYAAGAPALVEGVMTDASWAMDPATGILRVDRTPARYSLTYLDLHPTWRQLTEAGESSTFGPQAGVRDVSSVSSQVAQTAERVTQRGHTDIERAMLLQEWLRSSGGFTYSLTLAPPPADLDATEAGATAVDRFLQTKRGYCVQFASAMTLMSRAVGIPARTVTGFLPGRPDGGERVVLASDAHAWTELYFEGIGWLRFEPTPAERSGPAPDYHAASPRPTPSASPTQARPTPSASRSAAPTSRPTQRPDTDTGAVAPKKGVDLRAAAALALLALVVAVGAAPAVAAAWVRARRRRNATDSGARAEATWAEIAERLADLGADLPPAATPLEQAAPVAEALDEGAGGALLSLARDVEQARYAPTGPAEAPEPDRRVALACRGYARTRPVPTRLRAALLPTVGLTALHLHRPTDT